jgi:hypothetical protein
VPDPDPEEEDPEEPDPEEPEPEEPDDVEPEPVTSSAARLDEVWLERLATSTFRPAAALRSVVGTTAIMSPEFTK